MAGCADAEPPPTSTGTSAHQPGTGLTGAAQPPQPLPIDSICPRFGEAYLASDTRHDTSAHDARERAAQQYGTPNLQQRLASGPGRDNQWHLWSQHDARIHTNAEPYAGDALPTPTEPTTAYRATLITRHAIGDDTWTQPLPPVTVYCTLVSADDGWLVDDVDLSITSHS